MPVSQVRGAAAGLHALLQRHAAPGAPRHMRAAAYGCLMQLARLEHLHDPQQDPLQLNLNPKPEDGVPNGSGGVLAGPARFRPLDALLRTALALYRSEPLLSLRLGVLRDALLLAGEWLREQGQQAEGGPLPVGFFVSCCVGVSFLIKMQQPSLMTRHRLQF